MVPFKTGHYVLKIKTLPLYIVQNTKSSSQIYACQAISLAHIKLMDSMICSEIQYFFVEFHARQCYNTEVHHFTSLEI